MTARYRAGVRSETTVGATPARIATADDYDTFFQPDGAVIVSGTTGDASMRSFSVGQRAWIGRLAGVDLVAGYRFRFDKAAFGVGHKTVTRDGALVEATDVASPRRRAPTCTSCGLARRGRWRWENAGGWRSTER